MHVDWLTVWVPDRNRLPFAPGGKALRGRFGYPGGWTVQDGLECFVDEAQAVLVAKGEYLAESQDRVVEFARLGRVSRIDFADDTFPLTPDQVVELFDVEAIVPYARAGAFHFDLDTRGKTVEFGRRISERFLRIYDRRGPVRIELELKGAAAHEMGAVVADGQEVPRRIFRSVFRAWPDKLDDWAGQQGGELVRAIRHAKKSSVTPWQVKLARHVAAAKAYRRVYEGDAQHIVNVTDADARLVQQLEESNHVPL